MFRLDLGPSARYCDGVNRRSFLQLGVAGMAAVGLPRAAPREGRRSLDAARTPRSS